MSIIGTRDRKVIDSTGVSRVYNIRRLRCSNCRRIHHELPDFLVPYKRYGSECIEMVLTNPDHHSVAADDSTLSRWKSWFHYYAEYWVGCLNSILLRVNQEVGSLALTSAKAGNAPQRLGRLVGDANGWLARVVRPIVNINFWIHTRSAFLSNDL